MGKAARGADENENRTVLPTGTTCRGNGVGSTGDMQWANTTNHEQESQGLADSEVIGQGLPSKLHDLALVRSNARPAKVARRDQPCFIGERSILFRIRCSSGGNAAEQPCHHDCYMGGAGAVGSVDIPARRAGP